MNGPASASAGDGRATAIRFACFFLLWLAISGLDLKALPVAAAAAAAATWLSLRLLPASAAPVRPAAAIAFGLDFLRLAFLSGLDVARRALRPNMDLQPGFVAAPLRLEPGAARDAFLALASLLPGTLPTGVEDSDPRRLILHGLDTRQPVAEELAAEEALFMRTIGRD